MSGPTRNLILTFPPCAAFAGEYGCLGTGKLAPITVIPVGFEPGPMPDLGPIAYQRRIFLEYCLQLKPDSPLIGVHWENGVFHTVAQQFNEALRRRFGDEGRFIVPDDAEFLVSSCLIAADLGHADGMIWHALNLLRYRASQISNHFVATKAQANAALTKALRGDKDGDDT